MATLALWRIEPFKTTTGATAVYLPLVLVNRGLALVRVLLVGAILGAAGKGEFGRYQLALELINWAVALVMFGLAEVAERYVADFERRGALAGLLKRQAGRLVMTGGAAALLLVAAAPLVGRWLYGDGGTLLIVLAAANILALAFYQWLVGVLRGMRAYGAAAGMETVAAVLMLGLSALAAWRGSAAALLGAYAISTTVPLAYYVTAVAAKLKTPNARPETTATDAQPPRLGRFGLWTMLRLMLAMTFGLLAVWGVRWLAGSGKVGDAAAGEYAMPYRIAQMLSYVGVTIWASTYALAATAWAHRAHRRASVLFLGVGKFGGLALVVTACLMLMLRGVLVGALPAYREGIADLLPPLLGVFLAYAMVGFLVSYGDLQERPWVGATLWATAVGVQALVIGVPAIRNLLGLDAKWTVVAACALGLGAASLLVGPVLLWRPVRLTATAAPLGLVLIGGLAYYLPAWLVDVAVPVVTLVVAGFLWSSGLLIRRREKRAWRRLRGPHRGPRQAAADSPTSPG